MQIYLTLKHWQVKLEFYNININQPVYSVHRFKTIGNENNNLKYGTHMYWYGDKKKYLTTQKNIWEKNM